MPNRRTNLQTHAEQHETLAELLRSRALASTPRLLVGQAFVGVALNSAVLAWHPDRWGIATAAMVTIISHALWTLAVQRTSDALSPATARDDALDLSATSAARARWWPVRRASAFAASISALLVMWFVCMMLLGRMIS